LFARSAVRCEPLRFGLSARHGRPTEQRSKKHRSAYGSARAPATRNYAGTAFIALADDESFLPSVSPRLGLHLNPHGLAL
jgi:hypothetical protein